MNPSSYRPRVKTLIEAAEVTRRLASQGRELPPLHSGGYSFNPGNG